MLGQCGFGGVYEEYLREYNYYNAVKKASRQSKQGIKEYASEVGIISRLTHKHLVQLSGKASKETNVYSFGIVVLEIGWGRKSIEHKAEEHQVNIIEWVWRLYGIGNLHEAVKPILSSEFNEQEVEHLLIVGLWCAQLLLGKQFSIFAFNITSVHMLILSYKGTGLSFPCI
ncbi:hypothetical protein RDI58_024367 [Solanum bulbocastanum]|uniref:Protein kinase domain-containing protein n=1 Tax=Solanum bulbocastanum TaxID=147425 RepID=A0AAN8T133_SOLBU